MDLEHARERMVERQLAARGIRDTRVLDAMQRVPRHAFVPPELAHEAYLDSPLPIGEGQTISQPYIVALTAESLRLKPEDRVLEIGTGSGYAAAILASLAREVHSVERHETLAREAARRLAELGLANVQVHEGDGTLGLPRLAPFDAIAVTASGPRVPPALVEQLAPGGRLVIPTGPDDADQRLVLVTRTEDGAVHEHEICRVRFVPLVGAQGWSIDEALPSSS
jgi:protein-L-isoaspartate(D-aspartate) O-methyltransferase